MLPALRSDGMATNSSATLCRRLQCRIKRGVEESLHKNYNAFCTSISGIRLLLIRFAPENHNFLLYLNRNLPRNLIWKLYYITLIQCRYRHRCFHFTFVYKLITKFFGYRIISIISIVHKYLLNLAVLFTVINQQVQKHDHILTLFRLL